MKINLKLKEISIDSLIRLLGFESYCNRVDDESLFSVKYYCKICKKEIDSLNYGIDHLKTHLLEDELKYLKKCLDEKMKLFI